MGLSDDILLSETMRESTSFRDKECPVNLIFQPLFVKCFARLPQSVWRTRILVSVCYGPIKRIGTLKTISGDRHGAKLLWVLGCTPQVFEDESHPPIMTE